MSSDVYLRWKTKLTIRRRPEVIIFRIHFRERTFSIFFFYYASSGIFVRTSIIRVETLPDSRRTYYTRVPVERIAHKRAEQQWREKFRVTNTVAMKTRDFRFCLPTNKLESHYCVQIVLGKHNWSIVQTDNSKTLQARPVWGKINKYIIENIDSGSLTLFLKEQFFLFSDYKFNSVLYVHIPFHWIKYVYKNICAFQIRYKQIWIWWGHLESISVTQKLFHCVYRISNIILIQCYSTTHRAAERETRARR